MEDAGRLKGRYELLDGEVIVKMGQNGPHAVGVMRLIAYCLSLFPSGDRVRTQATMEVREEDRVTNRPEPDVLVLREGVGSVIPHGGDVLLAVEVSDTTQGDDYGVKLHLYARAGVAEYWVLDLPRRVLVAFRQPDGERWQVRQEFAEADSVAPLVAPDRLARVADLLP
jgi:Uma2 family endonuclease